MSTMMECDIIPPSIPENNDPNELLPLFRKIRNDVIGSNKLKKFYMQTSIVPRLLNIMNDDVTTNAVWLEAAIVLGSLAKGPIDIVQSLVDAKVIPVLLKGTRAVSQLAYTEACLRCLRTILSTINGLSNMIFEDSSIIPHFVNIIHLSDDMQECIATIFAHCCLTPEHQNTLDRHGAVLPLVFIMTTKKYRVQMPALRALCALCYRNPAVSQKIVDCVVSEDSVLNTLKQLQDRDKTSEMQMAAAKCVTYLYRAGAIQLTTETDNVISHKTLPTLVRMCKPDKTWEERVEGAETLGYLIEVDVYLQDIAAISNHIISTLAEYFKYPGSPPDAALMPTKKDDIVVGNELRQAAFRAYASLCANSEDVRKKVIDTDSIMKHIVNGLTDPVTKVQVAAIRCLHALSRSVQQLRTSFADHNVWKSITKTLHTSTDETVLCVTTAVMCNLLLEFSPSSESILDECEIVDDGSGMIERKPVIIEKLLSLTRSNNHSIKLNAVWALMNVTFRSTDNVKNIILRCLKNDDLFHLVRCSDPSPSICMKTLGTLRNLLSSVNHSDRVMSSHGHQIMESIILILESEIDAEVKEQALCILTNIAASKHSKHFIMDNTDVLRKIFNYLTAENNFRLQTASLNCLYNLVKLWENDLLAVDVQQNRKRLKDMGVEQVLESLSDQFKNSDKNPFLEKISAILEELNSSN